MTTIFTFATIAAALRLSIPVALAAIGAVVSERSGVLNLGVEGMMLSGAFAAYSAAEATGSPWIGLLAGTAVGAAAGCRAVSLLKGTNRFRDSIDIPATAFGVLPADKPSGPHVTSGFITKVSGGDTLRVRHTPLRPPGTGDNDRDSYFHRRGLRRSDPAALPRPSDETLAVHLAGVHCPETRR